MSVVVTIVMVVAVAMARVLEVVVARALEVGVARSVEAVVARSVKVVVAPALEYVVGLMPTVALHCSSNDRSNRNIGIYCTVCNNSNSKSISSNYSSSVRKTRCGKSCTKNSI